MSFLLKLLQSSERRTVERRARHYQREAQRKREDPVLYQVKQKLKRHPDPHYKNMTEEELTKEAKHLTDPESLKEFFSKITHAPIEKLMQEVSIRSKSVSHTEDSLQDTASAVEEGQSQRIEEVGHLTLKLHLNHSEETPSFLTRMGAALLKVPYGVLHAYLEIGDSKDSEFTYIIDFNESSLIQPRCKKRIEYTALEATIPLGGRVNVSSPIENANSDRRKERSSSKSLDLSYACQALVTPPRQKKKDVPDEQDSNYSSNLDLDNPLSVTPRPRAGCMQSSSMTPPVRKKKDPATTAAAAATNPTFSDSPSQFCDSENSSLLQEFRQSVALYAQVSGEDLTEYVELSLSKILLIDKLVRIIVQYNKRYYYHSITRNCQTFVIDVLQSFGVWENFKFGDKLEEYLENLNKGRQEAYKSHKSVNDRVRYLIASGEINETTYDEARYLRSLYTIFHLEEAAIAPPTSGQAVCSDPTCLLEELEKKISELRPVGAMTPKSPEHYL